MCQVHPVLHRAHGAPAIPHPRPRGRLFIALRRTARIVDAPPPNESHPPAPPSLLQRRISPHSPPSPHLHSPPPPPSLHAHALVYIRYASLPLLPSRALLWKTGAS
ncbi:hypothetical protein ZWY2020_043996 [Hordeum vulgare]|nr:hypothetical protein ZWY2020_043996 [Hordeum vulgare]